VVPGRATLAKRPVRDLAKSLFRAKPVVKLPEWAPLAALPESANPIELRPVRLAAWEEPPADPFRIEPGFAFLSSFLAPASSAQRKPADCQSPGIPLPVGDDLIYAAPAITRAVGSLSSSLRSMARSDQGIFIPQIRTGTLRPRVAFGQKREAVAGRDRVVTMDRLRTSRGGTLPKTG
jgi:hypothetical protein